MSDTPHGPAGEAAPGDETRPLGAGPQTIDPLAEAPPAGPYAGPSPGPYAGPYTPHQGYYPPYAGYPGYPPPRPRLRDETVGIWVVVAVAVVALVIGGLGGILLGALSNHDSRFGGGFGPGQFHRGPFQGGPGNGGRFQAPQPQTRP